MTSQNNFEVEEILNNLRTDIAKKGYDNLRMLGKIFRQMNSYDGYNKLNKDEFLAGLRDIGILLPKSAAEDIDGCVEISDFLIGIRARPNAKRQEIIDMVFAKFDKDGSGLIDIRDLRGIFNGTNHPLVVSGEITLEQAFDQFLKNFNDRTGRGKIDKFEWDDYYSAVSYNMENDDHFIALLQLVWQV